MNRASFKRRERTPLLVAAVTSVASAGLLSPAQAGLLVDMRADAVNGIPVFDRKNIVADYGDTVTLNVVVRVSGTNAVQTVGNFDAAQPSTDTRNDDAIQILVGAFSSVGALRGNFLGGANANQGNGNTVVPWSAQGANNGLAQDFDSDGDLDLGALGTDTTNMWAARCDGRGIPTVSKKNTVPTTRFGVSFAGGTGVNANFTEDIGGGVSGVPDTRIIDATTAETLIGELTFIVTGGPDLSSTQINYIPRANAEVAALWFEDGLTTGKNGTNSPFGVGAPVTITVFVPEPSSLGLLGISSLGLLARRRPPDE